MPIRPREQHRLKWKRYGAKVQNWRTVRSRGQEKHLKIHPEIKKSWWDGPPTMSIEVFVFFSPCRLGPSGIGRLT